MNPVLRQNQFNGQNNDKNRRGDIILVTIVLIILTILIILAIVLKNSYSTVGQNFGTWSDSKRTTCINEGQNCTIDGENSTYRECIPNAENGNGCLDSSGKQTYRRETIPQTCTPICYSAVWEQNPIDICRVYTDATGNTLASTQSCVTRQTGEQTFQTISRTCVTHDQEGVNTCVKLDNSLAAIGETENIIFPCDTINQCYPGEWRPCGTSCTTDGDCFGIQTCESGYCQPDNIKFDSCGTTASECGSVLLVPNSPQCDINGDIVASSNCYPGDIPVGCQRGCFDFPCAIFPAGFNNVISFQNQYLEIYDTSTSDFIVADFNNIFDSLSNNPLATINGSNIITVTSINHGFVNGDLVGLVGATTVNGIPASEINIYHYITNTTTNTFDIMVITNATATSNGGGNMIDTIIGQQADAISQTKDVFQVLNSIVLGANSLATTLNSNIVTITLPAHGFSVGQNIELVGSIGVDGIGSNIINQFHNIVATMMNTFDINVGILATSTTTGGGTDMTIQYRTPGVLNTTWGTTGLDRVRFVIIPSQAEVPNGACYLLGFCPYNGQNGICSWDGVKIVMNTPPLLGVGQTLDDIPGLTKFAFTGASAPYTLNTYTAGPIYTPILCGSSCINALACNTAYDDGFGVCI